MFQVLRWGALTFGIFYGFTHQTAISSKDKIAAEKHDYERKEKLISDARAAWAKKNAPAGSGSGCKCNLLIHGKIWDMDRGMDRMHTFAKGDCRTR